MFKDYVDSLNFGVNEFCRALSIACQDFQEVVDAVSADDALTEDSHEARRILHECYTYQQALRQVQAIRDGLTDYVEYNISDSVR